MAATLESSNRRFVGPGLKYVPLLPSLKEQVNIPVDVDVVTSVNSKDTMVTQQEWDEPYANSQS